MRIIRDLNNLPASCRGATIALGNFDGVHLGHQAILRHTIATAAANGSQAAVMTFEPHPREFFAKPAPPPNPLTQAGEGTKLRLYSFRDKMALLEEAGIKLVFVMRFNAKLAALSAEDFVVNLLHQKLAAAHVVTGYNFAFGHKRGGDTAFLDTMAARFGMGYSACPPVLDTQGAPVSSSSIRAALTAGDSAKAHALLGRPYVISGHVQRGEQRGRMLGFPTVNLPLKNLFKPRFGVYAARVALAESNVWWPSVASVGVKPTFGAYEPLLEAHIFDRNDALYGKRIRIELTKFLRDERRFAGSEALIAQMREDSRQARKIVG